MADTAIALSGLIAGLVVSWMLVFLRSILGNPIWARGIFAFAGVAVAVIFAWPWLQHWLVNRRDNRVLAAIVQRKHRRLGDRLVPWSWRS